MWYFQYQFVSVWWVLWYHIGYKRHACAKLFWINFLSQTDYLSIDRGSKLIKNEAQPKHRKTLDTRTVSPIVGVAIVTATIPLWSSLCCSMCVCVCFSSHCSTRSHVYILKILKSDLSAAAIDKICLILYGKFIYFFSLWRIFSVLSPSCTVY